MLRRLNSVALSIVEAAAERAVADGSAEVGPVQMFLELVENDGTVFSRILDALGVSRGRVGDLARVEIGALPGLTSGRPALAEGLFRWFEDAWLFASVDRDEWEVNTGHLLVQWLRSWSDYDAPEIEALAEIDAGAAIGELDKLSEPDGVAERENR